MLARFYILCYSIFQHFQALEDVNPHEFIYQGHKYILYGHSFPKAAGTIGVENTTQTI